MTQKDRIWGGLLTSIVLVFVVSGAEVLYETQIRVPPPATDRDVAGVLRIAYGFHLLTWMLLGMLANYWWDHFGAGKDWEDMLIRDVLLPLLVSPLVFFSIWSLWPGKEITFALCLVSFQNGFFWQVVFSRTKPAEAPVTPRP